MKKKQNMTESERRRDLHARVLRDVAINRPELPEVTKDGRSPIVVALDEDLVISVFEQVGKFGARANLFVELKSGEVVLFLALVGAHNRTNVEVFSEGPLPGETTIGMLAEYALLKPDGVQVRVKAATGNADVRVVERRELVGV
jgi:hypothetical protein